MSKSGSIIIYLSHTALDRNVYDGIVNNLISNGWNWDINGRFVYMINATYDIESVTIDRQKEMYERVLDSITQGHETSIRLDMINEPVGIEVAFLSPEKIMFTPLGDIVKLKSSAITDFSFYLNKLAGIFRIINYNRIECLFD